MRIKYFCCVVIAITVARVAPAHADEVIPLVPLMSPIKADEITERFHGALANGLSAGGLSAVAPEQVRAKSKVPCGAGSCLRAAASVFGARTFGTLMIEATGKNYSIEVRVYRGTEQIASGSGRCDICTLSEALRSTTKLANEAATQAKQVPPPATPAPAVTPTSPAVPAPVPTPTPPPEGTPTTPPVAAAPTTDASGSSWPLWPALVSAGVGVVGLAAGIPLLAIDGDPTNCIGGAPRPDASNCLDLYNTAGGGWVLTGIGLAALTASGVLFYLHFSSPDGEQSSGVTQVSFAPTRGGLVLGAEGRF